MPQPSLRVISGLPSLKERLAKLYKLYHNGDAEGFAAGFAEDGCMRIQADSRLVPEAGPFHGRTAVVKGARQILERYEHVDGLMVDIVADIDAAIVRRQVTLRSTATGAIGDFDIADFVRLRNGEIVDLAQFIDTASLAVLAGRI